MSTGVRLLMLVCLLLGLSSYAVRRGPFSRRPLSLRRLRQSQEQMQPFRLSMSGENDGNEGKRKKRRIIRYDNVGDPVYEGDEPSNLVVAGFDLGFSLDASSATLLIFGLIAFNFLVLANADIPQFNFQF